MTSSQDADSPAEPQTEGPRLTRRAIREAAQSPTGLAGVRQPVVPTRRSTRPQGDPGTPESTAADPLAATEIPPRRPQPPRITRPEPPPPPPSITTGTATLPRVDGPAWPVAPPGHDWIDERFRRTRPVGELAPVKADDDDVPTPVGLRRERSASQSSRPDIARQPVPDQAKLDQPPVRPSLDHLSRPTVPLSRRERRAAAAAQLKAELMATPVSGVAVALPDLTGASAAAAALEAAAVPAGSTGPTLRTVPTGSPNVVAPVLSATAGAILAPSVPADQPTELVPVVTQTGPIPVVAAEAAAPVSVVGEVTPRSEAPPTGEEPESTNASIDWIAMSKQWLTRLRAWLPASVPVWGGIAAAGIVIVALIAILSLLAGRTLGDGAVPLILASSTTPQPLPLESTSASRQGPGQTPTPGQVGASQWSIDQPFISGDYTLQLLEVQTDLPELGEGGEWTAENGAFVVLKVQVTYTGSSQGSFSPKQQHLVVASGRAYDTDIQSISRLPESSLGVDPLKPNRPVTGYLVFDINVEDTPVALEFKGDFLADTVQIPLG